MGLIAELTDRWTSLFYHKTQYDLWNDDVRIKVVAAGRRSGKTELAKRTLVMEAMLCTRPNGWYVACAPTLPQAREIFWEDLKSLVHPSWRKKEPSESRLDITLINGATISVRSMDRPQRIEGTPVDFILIDEAPDVKEEAWTKHIRPALDTLGRPGKAWVFGVPQGRGWFYKLFKRGQTGNEKNLKSYTWESAEILPNYMIEEAKANLDEHSFNQEYRAQFIMLSGLAYYCYDPNIHSIHSLEYNPRLPIHICFDFNVDPGVAVIVQEQRYEGTNKNIKQDLVSVIGEVHIPRNSNTPAVCKKIIADWYEHEEEVYLYGDATGGARGTAKVMGSDWDIIKKYLRPVFQNRLNVRVPTRNPAERSRVNAMNSRLKTADGMIGLLIDPIHCPNLVEDFESVTVLEGGSGEIDKKNDKTKTHLTDALGYFIHRRYPVSEGGVAIPI